MVWLQPGWWDVDSFIFLTGQKLLRVGVCVIASFEDSIASAQPVACFVSLFEFQLPCLLLLIEFTAIALFLPGFNQSPSVIVARMATDHACNFPEPQETSRGHVPCSIQFSATQPLSGPSTNAKRKCAGSDPVSFLSVSFVAFFWKQIHSSSNDFWSCFLPLVLCSSF